MNMNSKVSMKKATKRKVFIFIFLIAPAVIFVFIHSKYYGIIIAFKIIIFEDV